MFWISEQIVDYVINGKLTLLLIVWILSVIEYLIFSLYYCRYQPYKNDFRLPVSVVVSVFREKKDIFVKCLRSIKEQLRPEDEVLIVFDGKDDSLQNIAKSVIDEGGHDNNIFILVKEHGGKRSTLSYGCDRAKNPIILTVDSDTILCPDCIDSIIMPFKDEDIGAVSAYQRIFDADRNLTSKFADYNELISHGFLQKATSAAGNVPVLYGRCLGFRKDVWNKIGEKYKNKTFMGKRVESGDDNDITLLTISEGYKTFMQSTAKVHSDCPRSFWKRLMQQYRFNRSSMRVTVVDWFRNAKLIKSAKIGFLNQITAIIFPLLVFGVWIEWTFHVISGYKSLIDLSMPLTAFTSFVTLITIMSLRNVLLLETKEDIFDWLIYSLYSWIVLNVLNIVSILTIFIEKPHLVQRSRNE